MSELDVRRARMEVEKSAAEFERALDRLREEVEGGFEVARDLGAKVKETSKLSTELPRKVMDDFIDHTVEYAKKSARGLFEDLRTSAEGELRKLDERPLVPWATLLVTGLAVGFLLSRGSRGEEKSERFVH